MDAFEESVWVRVLRKVEDETRYVSRVVVFVDVDMSGRRADLAPESVTLVEVFRRAYLLLTQARMAG